MHSPVVGSACRLLFVVLSPAQDVRTAAALITPSGPQKPRDFQQIIRLGLDPDSTDRCIQVSGAEPQTETQGYPQHEDQNGHTQRKISFIQTSMLASWERKRGGGMLEIHFNISTFY